jgi:hypothetical protein
MNTDPKGTDVNTTTASTPRVSYWAKPNRYAAACCYCGEQVIADGGLSWKDGDRWATAHDDCAMQHARSIPYIRRDYTRGAYGVGDRRVTSAYPVHLLRLDTREDCAAHLCSTCHAVVGLVKNKRGRWYLAETVVAATAPGSDAIHTDRTRCEPWRPHTCRH